MEGGREFGVETFGRVLTLNLKHIEEWAEDSDEIVEGRGSVLDSKMSSRLTMIIQIL